MLRCLMFMIDNIDVDRERERVSGWVLVELVLVLYESSIWLNASFKSYVGEKYHSSITGFLCAVLLFFIEHEWNTNNIFCHPLKWKRSFLWEFSENQKIWMRFKTLIYQIMWDDSLSSFKENHIFFHFYPWCCCHCWMGNSCYKQNDWYFF